MNNNLKVIRTQRGISQLELAKLTGIAPGDISRIENFWLKPYPGWKKRMCKALSVNEADLFPGEQTQVVNDGK